MRDERPAGRRRKLLLAALLALALVLVAVRVTALARERNEARRAAEAARIEAEEIAGLLVAREATERELRSQVGDLLARVNEVESLRPEVREVVRWRTRTVRLPCDEPIAPGATTLNEPPPTTSSAAPSAPSAPPPERPSLSLYVVGREARLVTRAGNWLAVGEVDLVRERDDEVLATLPWEADASDLLVSEIALTPRRHRWLVGLGPGFVDGELGAGALVVGPAWEPRLFRRSLGRWRPWATGVVAGVRSLEPLDDYGLHVSRRTIACAAAGVGLEW